MELTMLNDALTRLIGAYLLGPRIRQRNSPSDTVRREGNRIVYVEDEKITALMTEFGPAFDPKDISDAYNTYLADLIACLDAVRDPANKIAGLDSRSQLDRIAEVMRSGPQTWQSIPHLSSFAEDLKPRDLDKIRDAMTAFINQDDSQTLPAVAKDDAVSAFLPIGRFSYNTKAMALSDTTVREATGRRFRSGTEMIEHIFRAESYIEYLQKQAPRTPEELGDLTYTTTRRSARDVFEGATTQKLGAQELNFEVDTFRWSSAHPRVPAINPNYVFQASELFDLLYCVDKRRNAVLVGPPGCGKTVAAEQIAARLGRPFYRVPLDGQMRKREILGGFKQVVIDGQPVTKWFDGLVPQALREPAVLTLDEIDRGDPDLQYVAHELYEGKGLTILEDEGRHIAPNPHFSIIGTANTKGRAEGMNIYSLAAEMSEATRDRFPFWIEWKYLPEAAEVQQLRTTIEGLEEAHAKIIVKIANGLRAALVEGKIRTATSYRQVSICAEYAAFLKKNKKNPDESIVIAVHRVLVGRATDEGEIAAVKEIAKAAIGQNWEKYTTANS
jgi:cobaltochelatase CobS